MTTSTNWNDGYMDIYLFVAGVLQEKVQIGIAFTNNDWFPQRTGKYYKPKCKGSRLGSLHKKENPMLTWYTNYTSVILVLHYISAQLVHSYIDGFRERG
jgi:hypothetical protein